MIDFPCSLKEWSEDMPVPLEHQELPAPIRQAALTLWQAGDALHRIATDQGIEWWLLDERRELIEVFWLE